MKRHSPRFADDLALYTAYRRDLWQRCQGRCERPGCSAMAEDAHHTRKPRGPRTHRFLVALCRSCHTWVDAPHDGPHGRLRIGLTESNGMLYYRFSVEGMAERSIVVRRLSPREEAA